MRLWGRGAFIFAKFCTGLAIQTFLKAMSKEEYSIWWYNWSQIHFQSWDLKFVELSRIRKYIFGVLLNHSKATEH
jgi:hypothetical protein